MLIIRALEDGNYYINLSLETEDGSKFHFEGVFKKVSDSDAKPLEGGLHILIRDK